MLATRWPPPADGGGSGRRAAAAFVGDVSPLDSALCVADGARGALELVDVASARAPERGGARSGPAPLQPAAPTAPLAAALAAAPCRVALPSAVVALACHVESGQIAAGLQNGEFALLALDGDRGGEDASAEA